ncbi:hypothetical protein [Aquimarina muelleri]|uniref:Uncharacterized protein n=1 Tax=Aquimarina muelleri TaxID=279356 RepID=A0A918JUH3_9FLAO|nr:hypothetical protein [Aquimarina muelleri]MCX2762749.1 hypothetical protein [Aquimarina muelleri]GGX18809.1 hypothetical protein GCM10007384_20190 [Aquimarina muelleri]
MATEINGTSEKELKDFHLDILDWKSSIQFIETEIQFVKQLLNSYVFEPNTPNLFEKLQEFKDQMEDVENEIQAIHLGIRKHENELGGMLECDTISCDTVYYKEHDRLSNLFNDFYKKFRQLKLKTFSYAGGILKNNKKQ